MAVTGYGTVTGLKGANCYHDMYPVIPGFSVPSYTKEELENIDPDSIEYNGKTLTYYECTQMQRKMETAMRKTKRQIVGYRAAGDDDMFTAKSVKLRLQQDQYKEFSKQAKLLTKNERAQVYGFDRSTASKSSWAARKVLTLGKGDAKIGLKIYQFKSDMSKGLINTSVDNSHQKYHVPGKEWKNIVKQAASGKGSAFKSRLAKDLDPQELINKYAGTGKNADDYMFTGKSKYPDEFITLPFTAGVTYDKKVGKYVKTTRVQFKYHEKRGIHVFPVLER